MNKICIIGVGLIGGSFATGLKKSKKIKTIVGYGRNEENLIKAQALNVIDEYSLDIAIALKDAEMVGYLRVSVGTRIENEEFLDAFKSVL